MIRPWRGGALLLVLALAPVTACDGGTADGSATSGESKAAEQSGTPQTVECPGKATAASLPANFAAPLPQGAVVVAVQKRDDGRTVVTAVVPAAEKDVLADLQAAYPAAGLTLTEGETEERDAESNFTGGVTGRWGIRELGDCPAPATRIDLVVRKS